MELGVGFFEADSNGKAWQLSKTKRKTDRADALKLGRLKVMNQLPTVHVPSPEPGDGHTSGT